MLHFKKNLEIERLRGIAVILVFLFHSPTRYNFNSLFQWSFTGVHLFFVISGFVVVSSILRRNVPAAGEASVSFVKEFYTRRVRRILPASLGWAILYFVAACLAPVGLEICFGEPARQAREVLAYLSGFYNYIFLSGLPEARFPHYWSLAVEEQFYLVVPILLLAFRAFRSRVTIAALGILLPVAIFRNITPPAWIYNATHTEADSLFLGVLLALVMDSGLGAPIKAAFDVGKRKVSVNAISSLMIVMLALAPGLVGDPFRTNVGLICYDLFATGLVFLAALEQGAVLEIPFLRRFLEYLGQRSYSFSLCQLLAIQTVTAVRVKVLHHGPFNTEGLSWQTIVVEMAAGFALSLLWSDLSYRFLERPFMKRKGLPVP